MERTSPHQIKKPFRMKDEYSLEEGSVQKSLD